MLPLKLFFILQYGFCRRIWPRGWVSVWTEGSVCFLPYSFLMRIKFFLSISSNPLVIFVFLLSFFNFLSIVIQSVQAIVFLVLLIAQSSGRCWILKQIQGLVWNYRWAWVCHTRISNPVRSSECYLFEFFHFLIFQKVFVSQYIAPTLLTSLPGIGKK